MAPRHGIMEEVKDRYRFNATKMDQMLQESPPLTTNSMQQVTTDVNVVGSSSSPSPPTGDRSREFFLLPGVLLKWYYLYNDTGRDHEVLPAFDSWIWTYFPDGSYWREAVQRHGLFQLVQPLLLQQPAVADDQTVEGRN